MSTAETIAPGRSESKAKVKVQAYLDSDLALKLRRIRAETRRPVNDVIETAVREYFERNSDNLPNL